MVAAPTAELKRGEVHHCARCHISYRTANGDLVRCPLCAALKRIAKLEAERAEKGQG